MPTMYIIAGPNGVGKTTFAEDETAAYEKQLLEGLARLNRKIAELQAQSPNALTLNEKPDN